MIIRKLLFIYGDYFLLIAMIADISLVLGYY